MLICWNREHISSEAQSLSHSGWNLEVMILKISKMFFNCTYLTAFVLFFTCCWCPLQSYLVMCTKKACTLWAASTLLWGKMELLLFLILTCGYVHWFHRERERERERPQWDRLVASCIHPDWGPYCILGMSPDWSRTLNLLLYVVLLQPTDPHCQDARWNYFKLNWEISIYRKFHLPRLLGKNEPSETRYFRLWDPQN